MTARSLVANLRSHADATIAAHSQRFFRTEPGGYGEGDRFHGIRVPVVRKVAREGRDLPLPDDETILRSHWHEERLLDRDCSLLRSMAATDDLWPQRISVMATLAFIRAGQFEDTLAIADHLIDHEHDLIHKAVGWMLREIGNRDRAVEEAFLADRYRTMPRTMLRYAIETFPEPRRQAYLEGRA